MSQHGPVKWSRRGQAFVVCLDRPPANALSAPLVDSLHASLDAFGRSSARAFVLVSARPRFFAAGPDVKHLSGLRRDDFAAHARGVRWLLDRLALHDRPSIAVIEGRALGSGLELALSTTLRIGAQDAALGLPDARLGLIPGVGGTQRLTRLVGRGPALDMMLRGRELGAEEARTIGVLDHVVDRGRALDTALGWVDEIAGSSAAAVTAIMRCVDDSADRPLAEGLRAEAERADELLDSAEVRERLVTSARTSLSG